MDSFSFKMPEMFRILEVSNFNLYPFETNWIAGDIKSPDLFIRKIPKMRKFDFD